MRRRHRGFGLIEAMLALAIGLMLLTAASRLFVSAHQSWRLQGAALLMQADARLVLLRIAQDIRMTGMFGCLRLKPSDFKDSASRDAFAQPLQVRSTNLTLTVAELPGYAGAPEWMLQTDCIRDVLVGESLDKSNDRLLSYAVSRHIYRLSGTTLYFKRGRDRSQPLIDHVRELRFEHVQTLEGGRVDIALTLYEPTLDIEQHYDLSVAVRNPQARP
ncbi:PilW family protein [Pseudomonas sp. NPDC089752]|uniref:PilW family protein n=1 Tax=Pseudomonas sp. NPDC089752 TaxID=3364472 RepID=UPI00382C5364